MAKRKRPVESLHRFWLGRSELGKPLHVFDTDSGCPALTRCGCVTFDFCINRKDAGTSDPKELMIRISPSEMCGRCRMSLCFETWKEYRVIVTEDLE